MKYKHRSKYGLENIKIAHFARALGHPARISILRLLAGSGTCSFNEIAAELPLALSTVSQHLAELKRSGLIKGSPAPPNVNYSISNKEWKEARKYFKEFTREVSGKNNNLK
jgi:ArsR family transcriptional regulator, arsenate/arsenite/antimonite-responsive transcriptional repressor